jgi:hypothetical protein
LLHACGLAAPTLTGKRPLRKARRVGLHHMNVWWRCSTMPSALSAPRLGVNDSAGLWICESSWPKSSTKMVTKCGRAASGLDDGAGFGGRWTGSQCAGGGGGGGASSHGGLEVAQELPLIEMLWQQHASVPPGAEAQELPPQVPHSFLGAAAERLVAGPEAGGARRVGRSGCSRCNVQD